MIVEITTERNALWRRVIDTKFGSMFGLVFS